ncbi:MAG TPA: redoxin domain-containing protein [Gaiellaceae bacterium]|nr:redoxin domain-containing protein [Gaiellaceae bacterium]
MHAWLIAALVVSWVLVLALAGALYVLIKQHGELIMYQQDLNHRLEISSYFEGKKAEREGDPGADWQGLPVGSQAPEFALADLEGTEKTLETYKGEPFVVAFFSDTCGYCLAMAEDIGKIKDKSRSLVLISHGNKEKHLELAAENKWHSDVLIEPDYTIMQEYRVLGTPQGYLVNEEGQIASELTTGADNILALLKAKPLRPEDAPAEAAGNGHVHGAELAAGNGADPAGAPVMTVPRVKDVSESNITRDGLPAGSMAPNFLLQDLDGNKHALVEYRGKRVLLVFSDVECGPCEAMSPELVKLAEKKGGKLQVLMVSRGNEEANRRKAEAFGYPFPVLLQKGWEISKLYGMFATPIAYLIDEDGIIEKDVAVGPEPILDLV